MDIVAVDNLVKRYNEVLALDHFNLHIEPGEIFGLLGPNGSGKTTVINCILQLLTFDKGTIELFGQPMRPSSYDLKRRIGIVPQNVAVFEELTVRENIDYFCALYVSDRARRRDLVDEAIAFVGLEGLHEVPPAQAVGRPAAPLEHRVRHRAQARAHLLRRAHRGRRPAEPQRHPRGDSGNEPPRLHRGVHEPLHGRG